MCLHQLTSPAVLKAPDFFESEANLRGCHCNTGRGGGWLRDRKDLFFKQKRFLSR